MLCTRNLLVWYLSISEAVKSKLNFTSFSFDKMYVFIIIVIYHCNTLTLFKEDKSVNLRHCNPMPSFIVQKERIHNNKHNIQTLQTLNQYNW